MKSIIVHRVLRAVSGLVGAVMVVGLLLSPAYSADMTWQMKSNYRYTVDVKFFSKNRNWSWPGPNRVWTLKDSRVTRLTINCRRGEKICYGAWSRGNPNAAYWGVGQYGDSGCRSCCYTCGNVTIPIRNLNP